MGKKQDLNTACRATFKDGHTQEFASIEEASEITGLSIASIKRIVKRPPKFVLFESC